MVLTRRLPICSPYLRPVQWPIERKLQHRLGVLYMHTNRLSLSQHTHTVTVSYSLASGRVYSLHADAISEEDVSAEWRRRLKRICKRTSRRYVVKETGGVTSSCGCVCVLYDTCWMLVEETLTLCVWCLCVSVLVRMDVYIYIYVCVDCVCVIIAVESRRTGDE